MAVKITSSLQYLIAGLLIRSSNAQFSLNYIADHTAEITQNNVLMYSVAFLATDLIQIFLLNRHQLTRLDALAYGLQKYKF